MRLSYRHLASGGARTSGIGVVSGPRAKPEREYCGVKPSLSDEQILEMRALYEFAGWSPKQLQARFGADASAVRRVVSGLTRSRLVATRAHLPAGVVA